ncbi:hypothetical protein [Ruminococcus albus]|uniref:hypothetical protein n=1 Tax=Ruminococcus albus TaxID=1264 RepID=UPI001A9A31C8|nr:hypothetical protein [Ruminococcus albus]
MMITVALLPLAEYSFSFTTTVVMFLIYASSFSAVKPSAGNGLAQAFKEEQDEEREKLGSKW